MFSFCGTLPASKSLLNRALICQSYFPDLLIQGQSEADDVKLMKTALEDIANNKNELNVGLAGTTFRFLALRCARRGGDWFLKMAPPLRRRPHKGLTQILSQLSCDWSWHDEGFRLKSSGWKLLGDGLHVSMVESSQFLSSVLLNSWCLDSPLFIHVNGPQNSQSYVTMTIELLKQLGLNLQSSESREIVVLPTHKLKKLTYAVEQDMSSAFYLASIAAVSGDLILSNYPTTSLQPDSEFPEILKSLGVSVELAAGKLKVRTEPELRGIERNLSQCPDLFPGLATLCALANGESSLFGADQLAYKESHRIKSVMELIRPLERTLEEKPGGIQISGELKPPRLVSSWEFDPENDHRMAMAAAILKAKGYPIRLRNPEVVSKSFPEYWELVKMDL